jgi:hypothetical protein
MQELSIDDAELCRRALAAEQEASLSATDGWSHVDKQQVHSDWDALYRELAIVREELGASSPQVQDLIAQHYAIASRFYEPSKEAYIGMSLLYDESVEMRTFHEGYGTGLVAFLGQAMQVYAHRNLTSTSLTASTSYGQASSGPDRA